MRELYALVFSVCMVLIGTEMIVRLFPEKSGSLIHALAALMLLVVLVNGILKLQSGVSLDFDLTETGEAGYGCGLRQTSTARTRFCAAC